MDASDPAHLSRVASWRARGTSLTSVRVTDDGSVLAIDGEAGLAVWQPYQGTRTTHSVTVDSTAVGYATLYLSADGRLVLVSSPSTEHGVQLYDRHGLPQGEFSARSDTTSTSILPVNTWAGSLDPTGTRVVAFDIAGRG